MASTSTPQKVVFGQYLVNSTQVFFKSRLSLGLVNLMPVVKGHVLVIPKRKVFRFKDLTHEEVTDMFTNAQKIATVLEREYNGTSVTLAIQDGKDAGQTVEHVHLHIMPRKPGDFKQNDEVYIELDKHDRKQRTEEDMAKEAEMLSKFFPESNEHDLFENK